MVHQHFRLVPPITVAENVVLGEPRDVGRIFDSGRCDRARWRAVTSLRP